MKNYLLTKDSHIFGRQIYYIVGECKDKYLVCRNDTGYYSFPEDWFYVEHRDVLEVDNNLSLLNNKLSEGKA